MVKIWKVILAAVVIFTAGAVTGGLAVHLKFRPQTPPQRSGYSGHRRGDLVNRMERDLQLTPEQRAKIEQILRESQEHMKQLWESIAPSVNEEQGKVRERIRGELTPHQCSRFEDVFKPPGFKPSDSKFRDGKRTPPPEVKKER